jgi:hypothetical protein
MLRTRTNSFCATPALPGAACRGCAPQFDEDGDEAAALALCGHCGALQPCRAWFDGLAPRHRPEGVVAGLVHRRNPKTNRSTITAEEHSRKDAS